MNNYRATGTGNYKMYSIDKVVREVQIETADLIGDYIAEHPDIQIHNQRTSPARDSFGQRQTKSKNRRHLNREIPSAFRLVLLNLLMTRAGLPATIVLLGTSFVTTLPAPTTTLSPIVTPGRQSPNHQTKHHPQS